MSPRTAHNHQRQKQQQERRQSAQEAWKKQRALYYTLAKNTFYTPWRPHPTTTVSINLTRGEFLRHLKLGRRERKS